MITIPSDASSILRTTLSRGNHDGKFKIEFYGRTIPISVYKSGALVKVTVGEENALQHDLTAPTDTQVWLIIGFLVHKITGDF